MISKFKIGPAKTRDGRDAFVTSTYPRNLKGFMAGSITGDWIPFTRSQDGTLFNDRISDNDLMPNVKEPEWITFAAWARDNPDICPVGTRWVEDPDSELLKGDHRFRLRIVDGKLEAEVVE